MGGEADPSRVYEDLQPLFEWQEDKKLLLLIHLPGFRSRHVKAQINKKTLSTGGEYHVAGNDWKRFKQDFPVPEGCITEKARARVREGILTIEMPIVIKKLDQQKMETPQKAPTPHKEAQRVPPPPTSTTHSDRWIARSTHNYKQLIKSLTKSNEERQLLVNALVGALVIVAFGTYIYLK